MAKDDEKQEEVEEEVEDSEDDEDFDEDELDDDDMPPPHVPLFVNQKLFEALKEKVKKNEEPSKEELANLLKTEELKDEEMVVPIDFTVLEELHEEGGPEQDFETEEQLVELLVKSAGAKKTAEAFINAEKQLIEGVTEEGDDEDIAILKPMTVKEMKEIIADESDSDIVDGSDDDDDEDEDDEDEEEDEEPPSKKAKTE